MVTCRWHVRIFFTNMSWRKDLKDGPSCARGGHRVIGTHFAKMTPNFGFLTPFRGHLWPSLFELWRIPQQVMTLKVCILILFFFLWLFQGSSMTPGFKTYRATLVLNMACVVCAFPWNHSYFCVFVLEQDIHQGWLIKSIFLILFKLQTNQSCFG